MSQTIPRRPLKSRETKIIARTMETYAVFVSQNLKKYNNMLARLNLKQTLPNLTLPHDADIDRLPFWFRNLFM